MNDDKEPPEPGQSAKTSEKLRKVERDILIPRMMEYKINNQMCRNEQKMFADCAKESGFLVIFKCKQQLKQFEDCSNRWYRDSEFRKECVQEYLDKRRNFRETGVAEPSPYTRLGPGSGNKD